MKRAMMIVVLCVLGVALAACAAHSDHWLGEESTATLSHALGCGLPLMVGALAAALSFLPLMGRLAPQRGPRLLLRRPISFFQPPEHLS